MFMRITIPVELCKSFHRNRPTLNLKVMAKCYSPLESIHASIFYLLIRSSLKKSSAQKYKDQYEYKDCA